MSSELEAQGKRRADLLVARLMETLAPSSREIEKYYPPVNPRLFSQHDADVARRRILERDGYTCIYCGATIADNPRVIFHVDHIVPLSRGGTDAISNLVTTCHHCNTSKGAKLLDAAEQERILREVAIRNRDQSIDGNEHLHALGATRRARRTQKGR